MPGRRIGYVIQYYSHRVESDPKHHPLPDSAPLGGMRTDAGKRALPDCINAGNPYHECVDFCSLRIAADKAKAAAATAARLEDDRLKVPPAERTVHPDCPNAANPYHQCGDDCFRKIIEARERIREGQSGAQPEDGAPDGFQKSEVPLDDKEPGQMGQNDNSTDNDKIPIQTGQSDGNDTQHVQHDTEANYPILNERQKKLLELSLKMSEARKANQTAMVAEKKKMEAPTESRGVSKQTWIDASAMEDRIPEPEKPHFFSVLMPGRFEQKLKIPLAFNKHIIHDNNGLCTIRSPFGTSWHVKFQEEQTSIYIGEGWKEFVDAHELKIGYFLVFCYEGDMTFSVEIFDHSNCRKEYTPIVREGVEKEAKFQDATAVSPTVPLKRVMAKKNEPTSSDRQEKVTSLESRGRRLKCWSNENQHHYEKIIHSTERRSLDFSKRFCDSNGLTSHMVLILKDPKGRSWDVNFTPSTQMCYLGKGWMEFLEGNDLKVGNRCIFKLETQGIQKIMDVEILEK